MCGTGNAKGAPRLFSLRPGVFVLAVADTVIYLILQGQIRQSQTNSKDVLLPLLRLFIVERNSTR
jgi:hypothetical protein